MNHPSDLALELAKLTVRAKYPLAYQDYLGHVWTDDLYNCDTHCLVACGDPCRASGAGSRDMAREAWLKAAKFCGFVEVKLTAGTPIDVAMYLLGEAISLLNLAGPDDIYDVSWQNRVDILKDKANALSAQQNQPVSNMSQVEKQDLKVKPSE